MHVSARLGGRGGGGVLGFSLSLLDGELGAVGVFLGERSPFLSGVCWIHVGCWVLFDSRRAVAGAVCGPPAAVFSDFHWLL